MLSLAIYTNSKDDLYLIKEIQQTISKELNLYFFDFLLFTDNLVEVTNYNTAILSTFYMEFYKDHLLFTNINDYLVYRDRLLTKNVYLYINSLSSLPDSVDRNLLKDFNNIFITKDNKISMVQL